MLHKRAETVLQCWPDEVSPSVYVEGRCLMHAHSFARFDAQIAEQRLSNEVRKGSPSRLLFLLKRHRDH